MTTLLYKVGQQLVVNAIANTIKEGFRNTEPYPKMAKLINRDLYDGSRQVERLDIETHQGSKESEEIVSNVCVPSEPVHTKVSEKVIIRETNNIIYDFIEVTDDKNTDSFEEKQRSLNQIHTNLTQLQQNAILQGYGDLGNVIGVASQVANIGMNWNTLAQAGMTMSMSSFSGTLGMVSATFTIGQMVFGKKKGDQLGKALQALANLIVQGFTMVINRIDELEKSLRSRIEDLESKLDRQHYETFRGIMEIISQDQDIRNYMTHQFTKTEKTLTRITYDIQTVSSNLSKGTSLMTSNFNGFRFENFYQLVEKINYDFSTGRMDLDKAHDYIAELKSKFLTICKNGFITGSRLKGHSSEYILGQITSGIEQIFATKEIFSNVNVFIIEDIILENKFDSFDYMNLLSEQEVCHPAILATIEIILNELIKILPETTDYHRTFLTEIQQEKEKIMSLCKFRNPLVFTPESSYLTIMKDFREKVFFENYQMSHEYFDLEIRKCIIGIKEIMETKLYRFHEEEARRIKISEGGQIQENTCYQGKLSPDNVFFTKLIVTNGYKGPGARWCRKHIPYGYRSPSNSLIGPDLWGNWQPIKYEDTNESELLEYINNLSKEESKNNFYELEQKEKISNYFKKLDDINLTNSIIINYSYLNAKISIPVKLEQLGILIPSCCLKIGLYLYIDYSISDDLVPTIKLCGHDILTKKIIEFYEFTDLDIIIVPKFEYLTPLEYLIDYVFDGFLCKKITMTVGYFNHDNQNYYLSHDYILPLTKVSRRILLNTYLFRSTLKSYYENYLKIMYEKFMKTDRAYQDYIINDKLYVIYNTLLKDIGEKIEIIFSP